MNQKTFTLGKLHAKRFNVMVAGTEGLGKTTFLETFLKCYTDKPIRTKSDGATPTIEELDCITISTPDINIEVHLIDTPGFGMGFSYVEVVDGILSYIRGKLVKWIQLEHALHLEEEMNYEDERVHCLLFFIPPHRMHSMNCECLLRFAGLVPVVPIIAKADCMTENEKRDYVEYVCYTLMSLSSKAGMDVVYDFHQRGITSPTAAVSSIDFLQQLPLDYPWLVWLRDTLRRGCNGMLRANDEHDGADSPALLSTDDSTSLAPVQDPPMVFAVACSAAPEGQREYPFGTVETYNPCHSDLRHLQQILMESGVHLMGMIRATEQMTIKLHALKEREKFQFRVKVCSVLLVVVLTAYSLWLNVSPSRIVKQLTPNAVDLM